MTTTLITGGAGFLGVGIAQHLLAADPAATLILTDLAEHPRLAAVRGRVRFVAADLSDPASARALITPEVSAIYHLASLVSGGAEADFAAGYRANLHGVLNVLEAARLAGARPVLVFPSSIAAFGGSALPATVDDHTHQNPQNSYGVQKVIGEQLINDYSRKGFLRGRSLRLPAIVVRDEPNTAASGYASGLVREPLAGRDYVAPVTPETRLPILSHRRCVALLVAAAALDQAALGDHTMLNAPGIAPSAGEIATAVTRSGRARGTITFAPDPRVMSIVAAWPTRWVAARAEALGLRADASIDDIISDYHP